MLMVIDSHKKSVDLDPLQYSYKSSGAEKIYEKNEYIILRASNGFIVYNTKKKFSEGHTHLESFEMAKTLINNVIKKKRPKTNNIYILQSHIRICDDNKYIRTINELIEAKSNKTKDNKYYNRRNFCSL